MSSKAYQENWERIFMPANPASSEDVALAKLLGVPVYADPTMPKNELRLITSQGTVYRITNIRVPK